MLDEARRLVSLGSFSEAEVWLVPFLRSHPESGEASTLMGIVFTKTGRLNQAAECLENALQRTPADVESLTWLAAVRKSQGRTEDAIALLRKTLEIKQEDPEAHNLLGICLLSLGRAAEAESAFRVSIGLGEGAGPAYSNLGMALRMQNRGEAALEAFQKALELSPEQAQNYLQVFKQFQQLSRWEEAIAILEAGMKRHPGSVSLAEALALCYGRLNRVDEADQIFRRIFPNSASAANSYGEWLQEQGRFDDSAAVLQRSLQLQPVQGAPYRSLVDAKQYVLNGKPILESALKVFGDARLDRKGRMHLSYALGKLYDRENDYEAAMRSFDLANDIAYRTYPVCQTFDPIWTDREPELISELYSRKLMDEASGLGDKVHRPIFIVGMIRAGTTLLDQIVSSHPEMVSGGEGTFWNSESEPIYRRWMNHRPGESEILSLGAEYLKSIPLARRAAIFTDKMPLNYRHLGLIHTVFPNSKILHIRRDPIDTCLSIYMTFFAGGPNFAYNRQNIVAFYRSYLRHMEHWRESLPHDRFFELDYESMVNDPAQVIRQVIEYLGLPWNDACLRHEQNTGAVYTPSRWQARQPVYSSSIGRWRQYEPWLGPFLDLRTDSHLP